MSVALLYPYCSLLDVQNETRQSDGKVADKMATAINLASRYIEERTNRDFLWHDFSSTPINVQRRWVIGNSIWFPWPIVSLTQVVENGVALDPTQYLCDDATARLQRIYSTWMLMSIMSETTYPNDPYRNEYRFHDARWWKPGGGVTITVQGTFGYPLDTNHPTAEPPPTMPARVRRACTLIASSWCGENRREQIDLSGTKQSLLDVRIPPEAEKLLSKYLEPII